MTLSDQFWSKALKNIKLSSSCMRLGLIQFKVLHRIHYSKSKLSKIYPDTVEDKCNRCSLSPCDLTHMFWTCPKLFTFWDSFFKVISEIAQIHIQPSPHVAIFGRLPDGNAATNTQSNVIAFSSLIARRCILLLWKSRLPPSPKSWLRDILSFLKLEKN